MKIKKLCLFLLLFCLICSFSGQTTVQAKVSTVTLKTTNSKKTVYTGAVLNFRVKGKLSSGTKVTWSSGKKAVASVTSAGKVTAKKPGTTVIKAKIGNRIYRCSLKVIARKMSSLKLSAKKITLTAGKKSQLSVTVSPKTTYNKKVKYTSSDKTIVKVNQKGIIKAVKAGKAVITVKASDGSGVKASCTVTVKKAAAQNNTVKETQTETSEETENTVNYIAHRGYSYQAPENTAKAFELAGQAGFWGTETDVRITKDGEYILLHDATFSRLCGNAGSPENMTLSEIKALTLTSGNNIATYTSEGTESAIRICTLKEYLEICKLYNMVPIIELKENGDTINTATGTNLLASMNLTLKHFLTDIDNTVYSIMGSRPYYYISFYKDDMIEMSKIRQEKNRINMGLQFLFYYSSYSANKDAADATLDFCKQYGLDPDIGDCSDIQDLISAARQKELTVNMWTITSIARAAQLKTYGASYITTDYILW